MNVIASGLFACLKVINNKKKRALQNQTYFGLSPKKINNSFEWQRFKTVKLYEQYAVLF